MYGTGLIMGVLVDAKGPGPAVLIGAASLALGYYPIYRGIGPRWFASQWVTDECKSLCRWRERNGSSTVMLLLSIDGSR